VIQRWFDGLIWRNDVGFGVSKSSTTLLSGSFGCFHQNVRIQGTAGRYTDLTLYGV
jgi:hypothetical protein